MKKAIDRFVKLKLSGDSSYYSQSGQDAMDDIIREQHKRNNYIYRLWLEQRGVISIKPTPIIVEDTPNTDVPNSPLPSPVTIVHNSPPPSPVTIVSKSPPPSPVTVVSKSPPLLKIENPIELLPFNKIMVLTPYNNPLYNTMYTFMVGQFEGAWYGKEDPNKPLTNETVPDNWSWDLEAFWVGLYDAVVDMKFDIIFIDNACMMNMFEDALNGLSLFIDHLLDNDKKFDLVMEVSESNTILNTLSRVIQHRMELRGYFRLKVDAAEGIYYVVFSNNEKSFFWNKSHLFQIPPKYNNRGYIDYSEEDTGIYTSLNIVNVLTNHI